MNALLALTVDDSVKIISSAKDGAALGGRVDEKGKRRRSMRAYLLVDRMFMMRAKTNAN